MYVCMFPWRALHTRQLDDCLRIGCLDHLFAGLRVHQVVGDRHDFILLRARPSAIRLVGRFIAAKCQGSGKQMCLVPVPAFLDIRTLRVHLNPHMTLIVY